MHTYFKVNLFLENEETCTLPTMLNAASRLQLPFAKLFGYQFLPLVNMRRLYMNIRKWSILEPLLGLTPYYYLIAS